MMVIGDFGLSEAQERAQMAFWALWAAPLFISADVRPGAMRASSRALLQNRNLLRINQDPLGLQGTLLSDVRPLLTLPSLHMPHKHILARLPLQYMKFGRAA